MIFISKVFQLMGLIVTGYALIVGVAHEGALPEEMKELTIGVSLFLTGRLILKFSAKSQS